nr:Rha family transcriptional regulator [Comamonas jiangduensis]
MTERMNPAAPLTMSSQEIADLVDARHNDVVATIERLFTKGLLRSSRKTRREETGGRPIDVYDLIERDTHLVVSGYSDEHRARGAGHCRWGGAGSQASPRRTADHGPSTVPAS